ncbi:probable malate dehydrogenase, mitochondrial isoform X2 [Trichoplusia ni]|uniref:Malate dehydrogenase n=1 Tax=Trichoplusia ni TaxID=7111 RepID=A0A7E5VRD3_TRINI|nr:probable malate dehydrogenase, mitochondrial isoform X2 [Trichoplusia ni]
MFNCGQLAATGMKIKVAVLGAGGGIGQPLSLLLKQNPLISHLALYDIAPFTPGVAADLSHLDTPVKVTGHKGPEQLCDALTDSEVVVIPAGMPRKPGMTRDDLFNTNASIVRDLTLCIASCCPKAIIAIITNPVNSMVPIASEVMKKAGVYDPNRVLGVTTLDIVRSSTFVGEINGVDPRTVKVPVIGGHSGITIIPLLSQSQPPCKLTDPAQIDKLTKRIQEAGTEVVKAKAGFGSATLSMGYSGARFCNAILRGLKGEQNVVECAFVKCSLAESEYFATPITFGKNGMDKVLGYGKINEYEQKILSQAMPELLKNIKKGVEFAKK